MTTHLPIPLSTVQWCEVPRRRELGADCGVLAIVALCELLTTVWWLRGSIGVFGGLALHLGSLSPLVATLIIRHLQGRELLLSTLDLVSVLFFGPVGCLISAGVRISLAIHHPRGRALRSLMPPESDEQLSEAETLVLRIRADHSIGSLPTVAPFVEIMRWGTLEEKQRALAQIVRNFTPELLPALQLALADASNLVRVQAASTMTTLEERAYKRLQDLRLRADLPRTDSELVIFELARHLEWMAGSGVIDELTQEKLIQEAIDTYRRCDRNDPAVLVAEGRALLQSNNPKLGMELLSAAYRSTRGDPRLRALSCETVSLLVRAMVKYGGLNELPLFAREALRSLRISARSDGATLFEALSFWAGRQTEAEVANVS